MRKRLILLVWLAVLGAAAAGAGAQTLARKGWVGSGIAVEPWYRQAIFYQIDPVSFADADGDGFGDLRGITAHLDYVESLDVDAIVLSPLALEPAYAASGQGPAFDPVYGSLDDLDQLIVAASGRHLRVLVDLRLDQARTAAEAAATAHFWLARGVAGLHVVENAPLSAEARAARMTAVRQVVEQAPGQRVLLVEASGAAAEASGAAAHTGSRSRAAGAAARPVSRPVTPAGELLIQPLSADLLQTFMTVPPAKLDRTGVRTAAQATPALRTDGPDQARSFDRSAADQRLGPAGADAFARSLAMMLLTLPASPVLYFGQELGMRTTRTRTVTLPAVEPGDAGEPTPMPWDGSVRAPNGFSAGTPWIAMGDGTAAANVAAEDADPGSLLNWYRRLDGLRHTQAALREGSFVPLAAGIRNVDVWMRAGAKVAGVPGPTAVVIVNLWVNTATISLTDALRHAGVVLPPHAQMRTLADCAVPSAAAPVPAPQPVPQLVPVDHIVLPPYGCYAGELTTQRGLESVATPVRRSRRSGR